LFWTNSFWVQFPSQFLVLRFPTKIFVSSPFSRFPISRSHKLFPLTPNKKPNSCPRVIFTQCTSVPPLRTQLISILTGSLFAPSLSSARRMTDGQFECDAGIGTFRACKQSIFSLLPPANSAVFGFCLDDDDEPFLSQQTGSRSIMH
jgi:hypothetical protein